MSWWRDLVTDNPMSFEIVRLRRRQFGSHKTNVSTLVAMILLAIFYIVLLTQLVYFQNVMEISLVAGFQVVLCSLITPPMMHAAIAGERERRSWEMLLVAPLTKAQIVAGKFLMAVVVHLLAAALATLPMLLINLRDEKYQFLTILQHECVVVSYTFAISALVLRISAGSRKTVTALAVSYGSLFFLLLVLPSLIGMFMPPPDVMGTLMFLHPVFAIMPNAAPGSLGSTIGVTFSAILRTGLYLGIAFLLLADTVSAIGKPGLEHSSNA